MTFFQSLMELVQLRPEMFKIDDNILLRFTNKEGRMIGLLLDWPLQDDLDSILLMLDRRVLLRESVTVTDGVRAVRLVAGIFDKDWNHIITVETDEVEKNPAMQKALTAVVEELVKEKP